MSEDGSYVVLKLVWMLSYLEIIKKRKIQKRAGYYYAPGISPIAVMRFVRKHGK